jgi:hypothetical protein
LDEENCAAGASHLLEMVCVSFNSVFSKLISSCKLYLWTVWVLLKCGYLFPSPIFITWADVYFLCSLFLFGLFFGFSAWLEMVFYVL